MATTDREEQTGDAEEWRRIADHEDNRSKLPDLRRLTPGVALAIPAIDALAPTQGVS